MFSVILVDTFLKVTQIFQRSYIPLYMMKDSEIYWEDCLLPQYCPSCWKAYRCFYGPVTMVLASHAGGWRIFSLTQ